MHYYHIAPTILVRRADSFFTYHTTQPLEPGHIVTIPIGTRECIGIVLGPATKPRFATKPISTVVEPTPLPHALIQTAQWMSQYYHVHLASCLSAMLPHGLTTKRRARTGQLPHSLHQPTEQQPNASQQAAITALLQQSATTSLLYGVTGSGKTLVYKKVAQAMLSAGKSTILLVPEIALTPHIIRELTMLFDPADVLVAHSQQTPAERWHVWHQALTARTPKVAIGPRSALFLPLRKVGLIAIDEAHEPSYKQDNTPRYSALRTATMLAKYHDGITTFGSATPLVADYYFSQQGRIPLITLPHKATKTTSPDIRIIDNTKRSNFIQHRFISDTAIGIINNMLADGRQTLVFHNRRGTTSTTLCKICGWMALDPATQTPLTLHADTHQLISHISGYTAPVPTSCPECGSVDITHKGIGTKLLQTELSRLFPQARIARFDGDSAPADTLAERYNDIHAGKLDIIIGTQILAKGLDLPHLGHVLIPQADAGLALPDYTARERTFQLLAQVVGRVGRRQEKTAVTIQTYQPHHPVITYGSQQDYAGFYRDESTQRARSMLPPFSYLARFTCRYKTESAAIRASHKLYRALQQHADTNVTVMRPTPRFYEYQHGNYHWQIVLKSPTRRSLLAMAELTPASKWQYELDPATLL